MAQILSFPAQEPQYYTRLSLKKYDRFPGESTSSVTTKYVIRLPIPSSLQDDYGMETSNPSFGVLGFLGNNMGNMGEMLNSGTSKIESYYNDFVSRNFSTQKMVRDAVSALALAPGAAELAAAPVPGITAQDIRGYTQSISGQVRNPHLTTIFEGVRLKSYSFNWKMAPKSAEEAKTLNSIIQLIKGYMHPKIIYSGFALEYPYVANLNFEGLPDTVVPKVRDSFITHLSVSGSPAFYKDGQPVVIEMRIDLSEITIQTRENFINTPNDLDTNPGGVGDH
jgi:hypothetical protein